MQGSGHSQFEGTIPAFVWRDLGKPQKPSVRIAGNLLKIQTGYPPNMRLEPKV